MSDGIMMSGIMKSAQKLTKAQREKLDYVQSSGAEIMFDRPRTYNTPDAPGTGDITHDLDNAKPGIRQRIYHNDATAPSFPLEWQNLAGGYVTDSRYVPDALNIIIAEYISDARIEYKIVQGG